MTPDLTSYNWIVLASSGGKDSQCMLDVVVEQCNAARVTHDRLLVAHADLGRVEWPGTRELAEEQARHYGLPFVAVSRRQGDLLEHIAQRGMFPSPAYRFCISDMKRSPIDRVLTWLAYRSRQAGVGGVCILSCLGLRAEEKGPQSPLAIASTRTPASTSRWASVPQRSHGRNGTLHSCYDHAHAKRARQTRTSAPHTQRGTGSLPLLTPMALRVTGDHNERQVLPRKPCRCRPASGWLRNPRNDQRPVVVCRLAFACPPGSLRAGSWLHTTASSAAPNKTGRSQRPRELSFATARPPVSRE